MRQNVGQKLRPGGQPVKIRPDPRMHDKLRHRIAVVQRQKRRKFLRLGIPQPGFDGDAQPGPRKDLIQEPLQLRRPGEEAGALALGGHRPEGQPNSD